MGSRPRRQTIHLRGEIQARAPKQRGPAPGPNQEEVGTHGWQVRAEEQGRPHCPGRQRHVPGETEGIPKYGEGRNRPPPRRRGRILFQPSEQHVDLSPCLPLGWNGGQLYRTRDKRNTEVEQTCPTYRRGHTMVQEWASVCPEHTAPCCGVHPGKRS